MSTKTLLVAAAEKYDLHGVELGVLGSVRRGGKIPPMWNVPLVIYQSTRVHRMLIVLLPGRLGLFSPAVLRGKATGGGLESLERGSHTKVACLLPLQELSVMETLRIHSLGGPAQGSVIALRHSSGKEFTVNSLSPALARRIRNAVAR
ncbi:MAG: hypothetical protein ACLQNG_07050 [Acidimicrobiales bacterium]|jgi:hypothetical protein